MRTFTVRSASTTSWEETAEFSDDEHVADGGFELGSELRHIGRHARAGHDHGDGADRASISAETVSDTFMAVYDDGLPADHREDIAFRADARAGRTSDAVIVVDERVLRLGTFGEELTLLSGLAGASLPLLQASEVEEQEKEADDSANAVRKKSIHPLKITQNELQPNMQHRQNGEGVTERFMNHVPEMEHFL